MLERARATASSSPPSASVLAPSPLLSDARCEQLVKRMQQKEDRWRMARAALANAEFMQHWWARDPTRHRAYQAPEAKA